MCLFLPCCHHRPLAFLSPHFSLIQYQTSAHNMFTNTCFSIAMKGHVEDWGHDTGKDTWQILSTDSQDKVSFIMYMSLESFLLYTFSQICPATPTPRVMINANRTSLLFKD